jgi:sulfide dehydrogenase cytochrome subunit
MRWLGLSLLLPVASGAAADEHPGARIAASCAACHRLDGQDSGIPRIVGLDPSHVVATMQAFKADTASHDLMHAVSLTLSDAEITAVAHYLSTLGKEAKAP